MSVQFDPSSKIPQVIPQTTFTQSPPENTKLFTSTIVHGDNKSRIINCFWSACEFLKWPLELALDWVLWIIKFCPSEPTNIEFFKKMLKKPAKVAKNFASNPIDFSKEIFKIVLADPESVLDLREKNFKQYATFLREFKNNLSNANFLRGKRGALDMLLAISNFRSPGSSNPFHALLLKLMTDNKTTLDQAILNTCKKIMKTVGNGKQEALTVLKDVFGTVLPSIVNDLINNNNEEIYNNFISKFLNSKKLDIEFLNNLLPQKLSPEHQKILAKFLDNFALFSYQLRDEKLSKSVFDARHSIDLKMLFWQSLFEVITPDQLSAFGTIFKDDYPLATALATAYKEIAGNKHQLRRALSNLPKSIHVIKVLCEDFNNLPKVVN